MLEVSLSPASFVVLGLLVAIIAILFVLLQRARDEGDATRTVAKLTDATANDAEVRRYERARGGSEQAPSEPC